MRASARLRFAAFALAATAPVAARAYEEQLGVGAAAGYARLRGGGGAHGVTAELHAAYGLSDVFRARAGLLGSLHQGGDGALAGAAWAGFDYAFDVLRVIPWAGAGAGVYFARAESRTRLHPGASVAIGADYLLSRDLSIGADVRLHAFVDENVAPALLTVALRVMFLSEP